MCKSFLPLSLSALALSVSRRLPLPRTLPFLPLPPTTDHTWTQPDTHTARVARLATRGEMGNTAPGVCMSVCVYVWRGSTHAPRVCMYVCVYVWRGSTHVAASNAGRRAARQRRCAIRTRTHRSQRARGRLRLPRRHGPAPRRRGAPASANAKGYTQSRSQGGRGRSRATTTCPCAGGVAGSAARPRAPPRASPPPPSRPAPPSAAKTG